MKKIMIMLCVTLMAMGASAQHRNSYTTFERLVWDDEKLNVMLDTRNDLRTDFNNGDLTNASFQAQAIKLWVVGEVVPGVRYRLRQRLNRSTNPFYRDNYSTATDHAWIALDAGDKWTFTIGKQSVQFGTYEYDYNPADVYVPTMCFDDLDAYKTGINVAYKASKAHTINLQVINSDATQFANATHQQKAFAALVLWEGSMLDGKLGTRSGYGAFQYDGDKLLSWLTLGLQVNLSKFTTELDYYNGDRYMDYQYALNGYESPAPLGLRYVQDQSVSVNLKYDFGKVKPFLKGTWNNRYDKNSGMDAYQTSGIQAVVEYYPFTDNKYIKDLRFHAMAAYNTTQFKGSFTDLENSNNTSVLVGMRWLFKAK